MRILRKPLALNIMAVRSTRGQVLPTVAELNSEDWQPLIKAFQDADNLGSLITPPLFDADKLRKQLDDLEISNPIFKQSIIPLYALISQAELLRNKYWLVVANPPYMGTKSFDIKIKQFVENNYKKSKGDLFAVFMERTIEMTVNHGFMSTINQHSWMFLSSYEELRKYFLMQYTIDSMVHLGARAFPEIGGEVVQSTAFVVNKQKAKNKKAVYCCFIHFRIIVYVKSVNPTSCTPKMTSQLNWDQK